MRSHDLAYELAKAVVTIVAIFFLGLGLRDAIAAGIDGELRLALIVGIAGLGGFPLAEVLRHATNQARAARDRRNGGG